MDPEKIVELTYFATKCAISASENMEGYLSKCVYAARGYLAVGDAVSALDCLEDIETTKVNKLRKALQELIDYLQ
jgi:hypothetical protein